MLDVLAIEMCTRADTREILTSFEAIKELVKGERTCLKKIPHEL